MIIINGCRVLVIEEVSASSRKDLNKDLFVAFAILAITTSPEYP